MNEGDETKPCAMCAEPIRLAAKVCPYCRRLQPKWKLQTELQIFLPMLFIVLLFGGGCIWISRIFSPGRDFALHRNTIVIADSTMSYDRSGSNAYITVVGVLSNTSPYSWKEMEVEAQFLDQTGKLIDTKSDKEFGATILSGSSRAFRIRAIAARPEEAYKSHKVFVRAAKDARSWP